MQIKMEKINLIKLLDNEFIKFQRLEFPNMVSNNEQLLDIVADLLDYDSTIAGFIDRIIEGEKLSKYEKEILVVDKKIERDLEYLKESNLADKDEIQVVHDYKKAIDVLVIIANRILAENN